MQANRSFKQMHLAWSDFPGRDAMYAELAENDHELWKLLEAAMEK